jgi:hypothetical protein
MAMSDLERLEWLKHAMSADNLTVWERPLQGFISEATARGGQFHTQAQITAGAFYLDTSLYAGGDWSGWPARVAVLDPSRSEADRYRSAAHEWGHHRCRTGGCTCSDPDYFHPLAEIHAHQFAIDHLLQEWPEQADVYVVALVEECIGFLGRPERDAYLAGAMEWLLLHRHISKYGMPKLPAGVIESDRRNIAKLERLLAHWDVAQMKRDAATAARECARDRFSAAMKFIRS